MALIKCKECGKEISDTSKKCIHCGAKIKKDKPEKEESKKSSKSKKKIILILLGVTLIIGSIITISFLVKSNVEQTNLRDETKNQVEIITEYINIREKPNITSDILGKVQNLNYKEDEIPNNPTPYGLAKYCGEFYVQNICETEGIDWSILRFSQVYGKNEPIVRIIPILIERIKEEQEFTLFTTGEEKRRFLHVSDAVNGIICACLNGKQSIYNIAGEDIKSINEVIKIIEENFEKKLKLNKLDKINGVDNIPNIDKAKSELNYKPEYILEKGIQEIVEEIKNVRG